MSFLLHEILKKNHLFLNVTILTIFYEVSSLLMIYRIMFI